MRLILAVLVISGACLWPAAAQAASKNCGNGISAGTRTSCGLAEALFKKVGRDSENIADGRRVSVRLPATRRRYAFFLWRADTRSFTCRARGDGTLSVRIKVHA